MNFMPWKKKKSALWAAVIAAVSVLLGSILPLPPEVTRLVLNQVIIELEASHNNEQAQSENQDQD